MNSLFTNDELRELIGIQNLRRPRMDENVRADLGEVAEVIDDLGLPNEVADWFKCTIPVLPFPDGHGKTYLVNKDKQSIERAVVVGKSEFGTHVIDCDMGCVVYVDSTGETQLINTSIKRFLQFIAHFNEASRQGFENCEILRTHLEEVDHAALCDPDGIWSVTLESAEAGLF